MLRAAGVLCVLLLAPAPVALAQETEAPAAKPRELNGFLDWFQVPAAELRVKDSSGLVSNYPGFINSEGGSGRGLRLRVPLVLGLYLQGEHQTNNYDGFDRGNAQPAEAKLFRAGIGWKHPQSPFYGALEGVQQEVEFGIIQAFSSSGYGAHVGVQGGARANYYAQLGYVDAGDFGSGLEYMVGGAFRFTPAFALFADYRAGTQEDAVGGAYEFADTRIGLRINFVQGKKRDKPRTKRPAS